MSEQGKVDLEAVRRKVAAYGVNTPAAIAEVINDLLAEVEGLRAAVADMRRSEQVLLTFQSSPAFADRCNCA